MSELLNILETDREAITAAFRRKADRGAAPPMGRTAEDGCRTVLDALVAVWQDGDDRGGVSWAAGLIDGSATSREAALSGLASLEAIIRSHVIRDLSNKKSLATALDELSDGFHALRRCCTVVRATPGQRRAERALAECEARKNAILESALDPIITIDSRGVITEFNRAAEQVFGHSRRDVLGTEPSEVLFPASKTSGHQDRIERYLEVGEGSLLGRRVEVTAVRSSGETFPAELAMTISQEQGSPVLTFFVRDISQRKEAEKRQAQYAQELERSNRELEQFAYVASHDLQEPLRKIRTFGDRLQTRCGEGLDETGLDYLRRMQDAAERMQSLISGLLTLSRVTTKGQSFAPRRPGPGVPGGGCRPGGPHRAGSGTRGGRQAAADSGRRIPDAPVAAEPDRQRAEVQPPRGATGGQGLGPLCSGADPSRCRRERGPRAVPDRR